MCKPGKLSPTPGLGRLLCSLCLSCYLRSQAAEGVRAQAEGLPRPPPPVAISLNQTAVTIAQGEQFTFVADVIGKTNTAVSWAIQEGSSGGSITSAGIYTAPATLGTFHVIATSQADNTRHATATVTVVTLELSVSPTSDVLGPQGVRVFSIAVNSSSNPNVTWSVQEGAAGGSITTSGQYTAPKNTGSFHVVATSVHDPTKNATAGVTIVPSGFRPTGDMSAGRTGHTATLLQSGKVLMAGGDPCLFDGFYYENCPLSSAELYDPGAGTFAATGKMSVTRVSHTATLLNNGKVLVAGGHDASAELYDPTSGKFAATGSMSVGRQSQSATLLANGKVLIVGGASVSGTLATAELYDPNSGTFTATGTMTTPRIAHTATLLANGKVLITGGVNSGGVVATAELYDPTTGTFTAANSMAGQRAFHVATLLSSGNVLVTGGSSINGALLSSAEVYDVVSGTFAATGNMMTARDEHVALLLANGTVLVAGGGSASRPSSTTPGAVRLPRPEVRKQSGSFPPLSCCRMVECLLAVDQRSIRRSYTNSGIARAGIIIMMMSAGTTMRRNNSLLKLLMGVVALVLMGVVPAGSQIKPRPHVIVIGVNGMEWDFIRPLLLRGDLPHFAEVIQHGVYGKMRTVSAPNCPKVYTAIATSTSPEENGITGFVVAGKTASTQYAPSGSAVVDSVGAWRDSRHGQRARDLPGHASERLHDQRYAYPWQRLRGRDPVLAEAVGSDGRWRCTRRA